MHTHDFSLEVTVLRFNLDTSDTTPQCVVLRWLPITASCTEWAVPPGHHSFQPTLHPCFTRVTCKPSFSTWRPHGSLSLIVPIYNCHSLSHNSPCNHNPSVPLIGCDICRGGMHHHTKRLLSDSSGRLLTLANDCPVSHTCPREQPMYLVYEH